MVGIAALSLTIGVQARSANFVYDLYYDSARKLIVWGEVTTHPELKGRDYWEYNFCFNHEGKLGRVRVQYPPYLIVDEERFVTHWDYASIVEATTGNVSYLGRIPVRSSSGKHLFFEGKALEPRIDLRKTSIAMRDVRNEGTSGKVVVSDIALPDGSTQIDRIEGSKDGRTVAWSFRKEVGSRELHWSYRGARHMVSLDFWAFVVSSTGNTIYMFISSSRLIVAYDAKSGEYLLKQRLSDEPLIAFCADESSENLALMLGKDRAITLIGRESGPVKARRPR